MDSQIFILTSPRTIPPSPNESPNSWNFILDILLCFQLMFTSRPPRTNWSAEYETTTILPTEWKIAGQWQRPNNYSRPPRRKGNDKTKSDLLGGRKLNDWPSLLLYSTSLSLRLNFNDLWSYLQNNFNLYIQTNTFNLFNGYSKFKSKLCHLRTWSSQKVHNKRKQNAKLDLKILKPR